MKNYFLYILSTSFLVFLCTLYGLTLISFFLKIEISNIQSFISFFCTFIFCITTNKILKLANPIKTGTLIFIIFMSILGFCTLLSGKIQDLSYDGQGYHSAGTLALQRGWNPLFENINDRKDIKTENNLWIETYPHANNIWTLNLFKITGNIETGKGISLLLVITSILFGYCAFSLLGLSIFQKCLLIFISIINPINLLQIFTFGLDTQFYSLLLILVSLGIMIFKKYLLFFNYFVLFLVTVLFVNNKLTSIAYFAMFGFVFLIYLAFCKKFKLLLQTLVITFLSIIIAIFLFGYQPFVTNYKNHKAPFYPVYVSKEQGGVQYNFLENRPSNFVNENQIVLFFESFFFKTNGNFFPPEDKAEFKFPFTFSESEINYFIYLGPKVGGMGIFFSFIVILCLLLLGYVIRKHFCTKSNNNILFPCILFLLIVILSCISNPLNNAYRYIPQVWLLIPVTIFISWYYKSKFIIFLNYIIIYCVIINCFLILNNTTKFNISNSIILDKYLQKLEKISQKEPLNVNFAQAEGNEFLLNRYKVKYIANLDNSSQFICKPQHIKHLLLNGVGNSPALVCLTEDDLLELQNV